MIFYLDTSVVLPYLLTTHPNHQRARKLVGQLRQVGSVATTTLHTYGEAYNHLTRTTKRNLHVTPQQAEQAILNLERVMDIVELNKTDYASAIRRCVRLQFTGPILYDALHYQAALKIGAERLYSENLRDFTRLPLPDDPPLEILGLP